MSRIVFTSSIFAVALLLFTGCAPKVSKITLGDYYPKVYASNTKSILVLPAKNTTTSVDATDHFRYTITKPLAEKGYYVYPVHLVDSFFKSENLSDTNIIHSIPVSKLKDIFAPDAILYVDINSWDTGYTVVTSHVDVGLSFSLVDAKTEEELWQSNAYAYSYEGLDGNNGLAGLIISAIATALNTATDYTKLAGVANNAGVSLLPAGGYNPQYKKDKDLALTFSDIAKLEDSRLYVDEYFIYGNKQEGKVALTINRRAKGYFAFPVTDMNWFAHNGYSNYYITQEIKGKKYLRNRFFLYENNHPFLLVEGKKVFVQTETDGTIPFSEEGSRFYFNIEKIIELKLPESKS